MIPGTLDIAARYNFQPMYSGKPKKSTSTSSPLPSEDELSDIISESEIDSPDSDPEKSLKKSSASLPIDINDVEKKVEVEKKVFVAYASKPSTPKDKPSKLHDYFEHYSPRLVPEGCRRWCCRLGDLLGRLVYRIVRFFKQVLSLRLRVTYESPRISHKLI